MISGLKASGTATMVLEKEDTSGLSPKILELRKKLIYKLWRWILCRFGGLC